MMRLRRIYTDLPNSLRERVPDAASQPSVHLLKLTHRFPVPMRLWDTPVPIPNTTVKTQTADGTILETVWESRWVPEIWAYSSAG